MTNKNTFMRVLRYFQIYIILDKNSKNLENLKKFNIFQ